MTRSLILCCLSLSTLLYTVGCSDNLPTYPTIGSVKFSDGGSVHVGTIELKSVEHPEVQARGEIGPDGTFALTTYEPNDGAIAGKHQAVVVQMVMVEGMKNFRPSSLGVIHPKHARYATSGLQFEIKPGENTLEVIVDPLKPLKDPLAAEKTHSHTPGK